MHSAEWLRGAIHVADANQLKTTKAYWEKQLAAAEDREAAPEVIPGTLDALAGLTIRSDAPSAAEVIAAAEKAMQRTADHICDSSPYEMCIKNCPECLRQNALDLIEKWKEQRDDN